MKICEFTFYDFNEFSQWSMDCGYCYSMEEKLGVNKFLFELTDVENNIYKAIINFYEF